MSNRSPVIVFAAAVALWTAAALWLRLPNLGNRPMHGDEAVHAEKFRVLWTEGKYEYDPNEYHGPTIYYAALPVMKLHARQSFAETTEADYRLPIALIGAAMVPLLLLLSDGLGRRATAWACLFAAISPAFVFYSRYYIQEVPLVFFTMAAFGCAWRWRQSRNLAWLVVSGVSLGLMVASKETVVATFLAAAVAWAASHKSFTPRPGNGAAKRSGPVRAAALFLTAALSTSYLVLSGFFSNWKGPFRYLESYTPWLHRAGGTELHSHGWGYYLNLLAWSHHPKGPVWSEGLILGLALVGTIAALLRRKQTDYTDIVDPGLIRFVALYTMLLTVIYSAISYKTPWCALNFLIGMILLAGYGAATLIALARTVPVKTVVAGLILAGSGHLALQAYRAAIVYPADPKNPYVYAQPLPDVIALGKRVEELAAVHPNKEQMVVQIVSADNYYWPLPWYLRKMKNVGYWTKLPPDLNVPVLIASPEFDEELTKRLDATHLMTGYSALRPGVLLMTWVKMDLWTPYIEKKNPSTGPKYDD